MVIHSVLATSEIAGGTSEIAGATSEIAGAPSEIEGSKTVEIHCLFEHFPKYPRSVIDSFKTETEFLQSQRDAIENHSKTMVIHSVSGSFRNSRGPFRIRKLQNSGNSLSF